MCESAHKNEILSTRESSKGSPSSNIIGAMKKHKSLLLLLLHNFAMNSNSLLLSRIQETDASHHAKAYRALAHADQCLGHVQEWLAQELGDMTDSSQPLFFPYKKENVLFINHHIPSVTKAFRAVTDKLISSGKIPKRHGDEVVVADRVVDGHGVCEKIVVDRNTAPFLGIPSIGVHLNCYVTDDEGQIGGLWMAQRSSTKSTFPNCWDVTVAGGQPHSLSFAENLKKEAWEEAGVPPDVVASKAQAVSCLSQMTSKPDGSCLKHSLYYCWDLPVSNDFEPRPVDGEVTQFELVSPEKLLEEVKGGTKLRPAMRLVVTDFLMRHGVISPDNEPDYARIQAAMHRDPLVLWKSPFDEEMWKLPLDEFVKKLDGTKMGRGTSP